MQQPDLGKKIAELRKSKGFTQEELVEKCNLNVRTLQRIESGEVTPRSYTLKIIFAALEYNIHESLKDKPGIFSNTEVILSRWLEQLYKYVLDLFNFKTNVMKKIMILSVPFLSICLVLLLYSINTKAQQSKEEIRKKFEQASSNLKVMQWFNAGQIDSISYRYLDKAFMVPDQSAPINNRKQVHAYFNQLFNQGMRFSQLKSTFQIISDSIAVDRGVWSMNINSVVAFSGTYLTEWHYIHGKWWIENEMSKADVGMNSKEEINK
jgi:transcriptional regulator with XRE-family HTH domain